jgi:hypothetical protein
VVGAAKQLARLVGVAERARLSAVDEPYNKKIKMLSIFKAKWEKLISPRGSWRS